MGGKCSRERPVLVAGRFRFFYKPKGNIVDLVDLVDLVDSINLINKIPLIELIHLNPISQRKISAHLSNLLYNKTIEISC